MALETRDLERLADGEGGDRTIFHSTYCDRCGYNLRYAPVIGQCPECGQAYNARPLVLKGIFKTHEHPFPLMGILQSLVALALGGWILRGAFTPVNDWLVILGAGLTILGILVTRTTLSQLFRFVRAVRIGHRIRMEEDED